MERCRRNDSRAIFSGSFRSRHGLNRKCSRNVIARSQNVCIRYGEEKGWIARLLYETALSRHVIFRSFSWTKASVSCLAFTARTATGLFSKILRTTRRSRYWIWSTGRTVHLTRAQSLKRFAFPRISEKNTRRARPPSLITFRSPAVRRIVLGRVKKSNNNED